MTLEFTVLGVAQQMGSKRAFVPKGWSRPIVTDSNRSLKSWQQLVSEGANHAIQQLPHGDRGVLLEGVRLTLGIYLPRPLTLPKRMSAHTKTPDLDKIVRGLCDALAGIVFRNDSQVCELVAQKLYAAPGEQPRVDIRVEATRGAIRMPKDQPLFAMAR